MKSDEKLLMYLAKNLSNLTFWQICIKTRLVWLLVPSSCLRTELMIKKIIFVYICSAEVIQMFAAEACAMTPIWWRWTELSFCCSKKNFNLKSSTSALKQFPGNSGYSTNLTVNSCMWLSLQKVSPVKSVHSLVFQYALQAPNSENKALYLRH